MMEASIRISDAEFQARSDQLLDYLNNNNLTGVVLFDSHYILYYTGFAFIPTERPIGFAMNAKGEKAMFVPRLEVEHAKANGLIQRVDHYIEYPDNPHPAEILKNMLAEMGIQGNFGADQDGYPWIFGYRGPSLTELTGGSVTMVRAFIEDQMMIKSEAEIALLKESCKWGNLAHVLLQRYTKVGLTETEVSNRANNEATSAMLDTIGPIYRGQSSWFSGAVAMYRGQIGRTSAIPHALANNITFQVGDTLVTGAGAPVWGYHSELERTMFMGTPSDEQKQLFDHMVNVQDIAFEHMKPGDPCSNVDKAVRDYCDQHNLMDHWRHHTGHAIGIRYHEGPFLDTGDHTEMKPGMVFTVEPGLYSAQWGGFRHSDTVLMTDDAIEMLTFYPRDLQSLIIPV
jgi:Xaa-Pro aminopeptidase